MNHIETFEERIDAALSGQVPETIKQDVLTIAKKAVVESFQFGISAGELAGMSVPTSLAGDN